MPILHSKLVLRLPLLLPIGGRKNNLPLPADLTIYSASNDSPEPSTSSVLTVSNPSISDQSVGGKTNHIPSLFSLGGTTFSVGNVTKILPVF